MSRREVQYVPGAGVRISEPTVAMSPQLMRMAGGDFWISQANGAAVTFVTAPDATDHLTGAIALLCYQDPLPGHEQGLGLIRTFTLDDADEFADHIKRATAASRKQAADAAGAILAKAARK